MKRIVELFERKRLAGRAALIGYFTAGDPGPEESLQLLLAAASAGIDAVELGFPCCDPLLDGVAIRRSHRRALDRGGSIASTVALVQQFREFEPDVPIVLMGYRDPVLAYGCERLAREASGAGADAVILPDLPIPEAVRELVPALARHGMGMIPFCAPHLEVSDCFTNH